MAKIVIPCPSCGENLVASTSIFSRRSRTVTCEHCGKVVDVYRERMEAADCPSCGTRVVFNKGIRNVKCPDCKLRFDPMAQLAKETQVSCPQCGCGMPVGKPATAQTEAECPLCGLRFNVKAELERAKLVTDAGVSVIKYEGDNSTFVWKHPIEDFNMGSQLIVHESQEAIFFLNGQALDLFGAGRYTLDTENLPVLKKVYTLPTSGQNPFHAEVYFINKTVQMGIKWGTSSRVRFIDPVTGIPLDIGASGEMNLQVSDSRRLLVKLVGTTAGVAQRDLVSDDETKSAKALQMYFRGVMSTQIKSCLASTIKAQKLNILEIDERLSDLSEAIRLQIAGEFEEFGLNLHRFFITTILLPEEDPNFQKARQLIADAYLRVREQEVEADVAAAARRTELELKTTEMEKLRYDAEMQRIKAQAEADALRFKGLSEAEVMAAKGYTQRDVLQSEVQKEYAKGIGNMGGGSGGGGGIASDLIGVVAGMKAAGIMTDQLKEMPGTVPPPSPAFEGGWTCVCGQAGNKNAFCGACGKPKGDAGWRCSCGHAANRGAFCEACGQPKPTPWTCACSHEGNTGAFCAACGKPKPVLWTCSCGHAGNKNAFCEACGKPRQQ